MKIYQNYEGLTRSTNEFHRVPGPRCGSPIEEDKSMVQRGRKTLVQPDRERGTVFYADLDGGGSGASSRV